MSISVIIDGINTCGTLFSTIKKTCCINFLASYHQRSKNVRPNLPSKHGGDRIPESWLEEFWFVGCY